MATHRALEAARATFASLAVPNYRRFVGGQSVSLIGTWMQITAQAWLVLHLTHSAPDLGVVVAVQSVPVLFLAPLGGLVADRSDKRRLMIALQAAMGLQALALGLLVVTGAASFLLVCVLAAVLGLNNAFEMPARQAYVREMVGGTHIANAVSLNSVMNNAARTIGPAAAGIVIAVAGEGVCFLLNAASFVGVVWSLLRMDLSSVHVAPREPRERGQLREGFAYAAATTELAVPLLMMALVGTLAYEFSVTLPVLATRTFHSGAAAYGLMTAAMGIGAVLGGLVTAARSRTGFRPMVYAVAAFGAAIVLVALAPGLAAAYAALVLVGWGSVSFVSVANSSIQLAAEPRMRGRVLSLWQLAFQGTTPLGGPLVGWIVAASDPRVGLLVGAASCFVAALVGAGLVWWRRRPALLLVD